MHLISNRKLQEEIDFSQSCGNIAYEPQIFDIWSNPTRGCNEQNEGLTLPNAFAKLLEHFVNWHKPETRTNARAFAEKEK